MLYFESENELKFITSRPILGEHTVRCATGTDHKLYFQHFPFYSESMQYLFKNLKMSKFQYSYIR